MINYAYGGINTFHKKGEFGPKSIFSQYAFFCFLTPFTYLTEVGFLDGDTGDVLINSPGTTVYHGPTKQMEEGFRNDWFYAGGQQIDRVLADYPLPLNRAFHVSSPKIIKNTLLAVQDEMFAKDTGYEKKIDLLIQNMLIDLYRSYVEPRQSSTEQQLLYTKAQMRKHPDKSWTLNELANLAGYSPSRFSELYRRKFGKSPISDLLDIRLESSQRLLLYTATPIEDIAARCGFGSIYHFSKFFKKATGCSPTEFRANGAEKEGSIYRQPLANPPKVIRPLP